MCERTKSLESRSAEEKTKLLVVVTHRRVMHPRRPGVAVVKERSPRDALPELARSSLRGPADVPLSQPPGLSLA